MRYQGNNIVFGSDLFRTDEIAMVGYELEAARTILKAEDAEIYAGYYGFQSDGEDAHGVKVGARGYLTERLSANLNLAHDDLFGTNLFGGLTISFGGLGDRRAKSFVDRLFRPGLRNRAVSLRTETVQAETSVTTLTDPTSSQPIIVEHVNSDAAPGGDGSFESPLRSLDDLHANSANGATTNGNIALVHANSSFSGESAELRDNQRLLGEGIVHTVDTVERGTISLPAATGPGAVPTISSAPGDAITLGAMGNEVSGFRISGGTRAIVSDTGASDTHINRVTIQSTAGDGIVIVPSTSTTVDAVTFQGVGGRDIVLNAHNSTLTSITSTGATGGSIDLQNLSGLTTLSNIDISGAGGFGGLSLRGAQSGSSTNLSGVEVHGATDGISIANGQAGSTISAIGLEVTSPTNNGIQLGAGEGVIEFTGTTTVDNAAGSSVTIQGSNATITFGETSITNRQAVGIDIDNTGGTLEFGNTSISGAGGTDAGIDVQSTSGAISLDRVNIAASGGNGVFLSEVNAFSIGAGGAALGDGGSITDAAGIRYMQVSDVTGATLADSLFDEFHGQSEFGSAIAFLQAEESTRSITIHGNEISGLASTAESGIYMLLYDGTVDTTVSHNTVTGDTRGFLIQGGEGSSNGTFAIHHNSFEGGIRGRLSADVAITDFQNNTIPSSSQHGIVLDDSFHFDANPATEAFETVAGGTLTLGSSQNRISGKGLEIAGDGALSFDSVQVYTQTVSDFSAEDAIRFAYNDFELTIGDGATASSIDLLGATVISQFSADNALEFWSNGGSLTLNDVSINMNDSASAAINLRNLDAVTPLTLGGDAGNTTTGLQTFKDVTNDGGGFSGTIEFDNGANPLP